MPARKKTFRFNSVLSEVKGNLLHTAIFIPQETIDQFPEGRWRMKGTINGAPFDLAPQFKKDGSRFLAVSAGLRKAAGVNTGDKVTVEFVLVDPAILSIPEELEAVLEQDAEGMKRWNALTTGYQRSLIHYVTSVKNVDSRIKRSFEIVNKMKANIIPRTQSTNKK